MNKVFLIFALLLVGCASSIKRGDDNFSSTFEALVKKDFKMAKSKLSEAEWERVGGKKPFVYFDKSGNKKHVDRYTMFNMVRFLKENTKRCEKLAQEPEFDFRAFENNCTRNGHQGDFIEKYQMYSKISLTPLIFDDHPRYLSEKAKLDKRNDEIQSANLAEQQRRDAELLRLKKLSKNPQYQKCKLKSSLIDSEKMLKLWNKNVNDLKSDAKRAGQMTYKMEKNMDKSLSFVRTYKIKIKNTKSELKKLSNTSVSESSCKKMIPDYGKSNADQYM